MWQFYAFAALNFNNGAILVTNQRYERPWVSWVYTGSSVKVITSQVVQNERIWVGIKYFLRFST